MTDSRRYMEFATLEQTLREDRDYAHAQAEKAYAREDMDEFMKQAREFHTLAGMIGYPEAQK